jgi:hypothetical protein
MMMSLAAERGGETELLSSREHASMHGDHTANWLLSQQESRLMARTRTKPRRESPRDIASIAEELTALQVMSVAELCDTYRDVFGEPTRSRNKAYLRKKIAWRIQELAEGGLSERAEAQIDTLANGMPMPWRRRLQPATAAPDRPAEPQTTPGKKRDRRLPPAGTVLRREHQGTEHAVTVLEEGFDYHGTHYRSLSQVAREITGTQWNGLLFFGLKRRTRKRSTEEIGA